MTDDINAKVTVDATQAVRALESIDKNVSALRKELQSLGIDLSTVNKNLDAIERGSTKASNGLKQTASATNSQAAATDKLNAATQKRINAERQLNSQRNKFDSAAWDAQYNALVKATGGAVDYSKAQQSIISQRYALYDVANFYTLIGAAAAGAGIYAAVVGAQFQTAFSNVQRTMDADSTPDQINAIRQSLIQLSSQIPLTFQELSSIATVGNQMGLAGDQVTGFTETVARFSSVAGLSIDETSKAFGGFMAQTGLGAQYLENLGSSIAYVSLQSNATEAEILSLTREIAAQASASGLAADQIVGLAGSLARLRVPPERARGALTTYFETLNKAVAEGGDQLNNFAIITGRTSEELSKMVVNGQGAQVLRDFLQGIGDTGNTVAATQALQALGLQQLRVGDTFRRLSADLNAYDKDQENANSAFMQGAELSRQYSITVQNLASQWQIFINGINAVIDAVSGGATPTLTSLFEVINQVVFALANFINDNQSIARIVAFGLAVVSVTGALFILRGGMLAARGAILAFNLVQYQAAAAGIAGANGSRAFAGGALAAGSAAGAATGRVLGLGRAMALIGKTGLVGLAITAGGAVLGKLASGLVNTDSSAKNATLSMAQYNQAMADANAKMKSGSGEASNLADQLGGGPGGGGGVAGGADAAAQKVRILTDYVSDLTGVFKRSSDIRFGPQAAMDEITLKWINLNEKIDEYQRKVRTLTADKSLREYWLQNALAYDDQIRASQLREEIAKIDDDLADANKGASTELKGNSKAAIENRKTMRDLAGSYDDYIAALAAAGVSQADIQNIIQSLNSDFVTQSANLGYAGNDVQAYAARFADLSKIVAQIPTDITIGFNPDPAQQALDEFFAKVQEQAAAAGNAAGGGGGGGFGGGFGDGLGAGLDGAEGLMNEFWNGEVDAAPDYGKGAGDIWAENLIDAATSLDFKRVWDLLVQGWNDTVAQTDWFKNIKAIFDAGAVFMKNTGDWWGSLWGYSASDAINNSLTMGNPVGSWADSEKTRSGVYSTTSGVAVGTGIAGGINSAVTNSNPLGNWASSEKGRSGTYSTTTGQAVGSGISGGINSILNSTNSVANWANGLVASGSAWNSGAYAGDSVGRGIIGGIRNQLANFQITGSMFQSSNYGPLKGGYGWATGGYTGAGHWLQPAGVVHRGEYVVPKKHVDQRTGLPDMGYMASLRGAKSAPKAGYANGGFVNSGFPSSMELGAHSLQYLANALSVKIGIGDKELSNASSRGDRKNSWAGTN